LERKSVAARPRRPRSNARGWTPALAIGREQEHHGDIGVTHSFELRQVGVRMITRQADAAHEPI
jgi:hypothetical protein